MKRSTHSDPYTRYKEAYMNANLTIWVRTLPNYKPYAARN